MDNDNTNKLRLAGGMSLPVPVSEALPGFGVALHALPAVLFRHIPTGFPQLDAAFLGGLVAGDLMLVAGKQNVGKTIAVLQIARNVACWARRHGYPLMPCVISYEHDAWDLFARLLCMEGYIVSPDDPLPYAQINTAVQEVKERGAVDSPAEFLDALFATLPPSASRALTAISTYADHLLLYYGNRQYTTVQDMHDIVTHYRDTRKRYLLMIIDYLQTIPPLIHLVDKALSDPDLVNAANIGALKDLAVRNSIPVIAVAAVDDQALKANRPVHLEDVFGPIQAKFTPDRAVILNPEGVRAGADEDLERITQIRVALEKNRKGPSDLEWTHRRVGSAFYIEPTGAPVSVADSFQHARMGGVQERRG